MRAMGHVMTTPLASTNLRSLMILAAAAFSAAAGAQIAQAPASVAGGEVNGLSLAPRTETTQLGISVGAGETDNIFLTPSPTESQTLGMVGLDFDLKRQGTRLDVDTNGAFQYIDYLQNAYGKQLFGRFDGLASLELIPGVWKWVVQDDFGQGQLDPTAPLIPTNLEKINVLSTGPDFKFRLGGTGFVALGLRYALTHYETSPLSGNRQLANLSVGEEISPTSSLSLNVDEQRLRFDNTEVNTDYDRRELYARYQLHGARTELNLDLGVSQTDDSGRWVSAALAQLSARRLISAATTLTLALGHQLTDAADSFGNLKGGTGGIVIAPVAGTSSAYLSNYGSADLRFESHRTTITVSARWERDSYAQFAALDASRGAVSADLARRMTPLWSFDVLGSWQRIHYVSVGYYETDWPIGAALIMAPGKRADFKLRVDHVRHSVTGPGSDFTENRAFLIAEYRPWP
jgi:hypothetical protein